MPGPVQLFIMPRKVKNKQPALFEESEDEADGGAQLKVNDEYAKRFEYNKKREERQRLEERFGKSSATGASRDDEDEDEDDSSDDETEDENGYLATEELDAQLNATLEALRKKDPRIYDPEATFYSPIDAESADAQPKEKKEKKEKPVTLKDYHRERILAGDTGADDEQEPPQTYEQEQDDMKKDILGEINAQISEDEDDFLKPKAGEAERVRKELIDGMHPSRAAIVKPKKALTELDVANADKDPQTYLSNFLAARAWIEPGKKNWEAFDSDDEEDNGKADEWEVAFNLRFEDPSKSNEVLKSYARDVVDAKSVRRDEKTGRKKKRDEERAEREAEKQERREGRNRLRNLRIEEAEVKLKQIKKAAGLSGQEVNDEEWIKFLNEAWDNDKWEEEMNRRFGDQYYADGDANGEVSSDDEDSKKSKVKKPKWDDDIDIKDLVTDFVEEEQPDGSLSDVEETGRASGEDEDEDDQEEDGPSHKRQKTSKDRKKERLLTQKEARKQRSNIEALVDAKMDIDDPVLPSGSSETASGPKFAYRETWRASYGLTAKDILMAPSDAALNEYVGLKKLAHFRPEDKKAKDKKRLGKKARLRQWRKDTFGPEAEREGPTFAFGGPAHGDGKGAPENESNIIEGASKKRKKRSGRNKDKAVSA